MTGGTVVVLGVTGRNFAAGMSGGIAYVYDEDGDFARRCNPAMVALEPVLTEKEQRDKVPAAIWHAVNRGAKGEADEAILRRLIEAHFRFTGSFRAKDLLSNWTTTRGRFIKVFPTEYKRALGELAAAREKSTASQAA
jgi:glutamate synthase (NADPH) large chain